MADFNTISLTYDDPIDNVATITIDREEKLNSLNPTVIQDLELVLSELEIKEKEGKLRGIVVTGSGKSFVAGADIEAMSDMSPPKARNFLLSAQQALNRFEQLGVPVIAKINGYALGGGLELALACDIRVASEKAVLGLPEVSLGIMPAAGGTQRLTQLVGPGISKYLIFTAKRISAEEALEYSIVNEVTAHDELGARVKGLMEEIIKNAPIALSAAKRSIQVALNDPLRTGLEIELNNAVECFQSDDLKEGMNAYLEDREPDYKGK